MVQSPQTRRRYKPRAEDRGASEGFYQGPVAERIVAALAERGAAEQQRAG